MWDALGRVEAQPEVCWIGANTAGRAEIEPRGVAQPTGEVRLVFGAQLGQADPFHPIEGKRSDLAVLAEYEDELVGW